MKDRDKLSFRARSRLLPLIGSLVLALAITGAMFAGTYTTAALELDATEKDEFATVTTYSAPSWPTNVWCRYKGSVPTGQLFKITPEATYTGDLVVKVHLTNIDKLAKGYRYLKMRLKLYYFAACVPLKDVTAWEDGTHPYELLNLENGVVTFVAKEGVGGDDDHYYYVYLDGGCWHAHPWKVGSVPDSTYYSPMLYCEASQR